MRRAPRAALRDACLAVLACVMACVVPAPAQSLASPSSLDTPAVARPRAISGMSSSARYCLSGQAANVHPIGWLATNTEYTFSFESDIPLVAAAARFDLADNRISVNYGTPEIARTAGSPGTIGLFVSGGGQSGCYRYKSEIRLPTSLTAAAAPDGASAASSAADVEAVGPLAIAGLGSSAPHCISGASSVGHVHEIGRVDEGKRVTFTFSADFNAVAGAMLVNVATQQHTAWRDDNSGGGVEPALTITTPHAGTLALYVAGVNGAAGCYRYKVEIR